MSNNWTPRVLFLDVRREAYGATNAWPASAHGVAGAIADLVQRFGGFFAAVKPVKTKFEPEQHKQLGYKLLEVDKEDTLLRGMAKILVQRVAVQEKGWPVGEYIDRYLNESKLFVVCFDGRVVGTVLIVEGDRRAFPLRLTEAWPELQLPPGSSAEIPFVLVDREFRGSSGVSFILCAACHWYFVQAGIDYMELTLDKQLFDFYLRHGMQMEEVSSAHGGGEKRHWGEAGIFPARLFVGDPDKNGSMGFGVRSQHPEMWQVFLKYAPSDYSLQRGIRLEAEYRILLGQIAQERNWPEHEVDQLAFAVGPGLVRKTWVALSEHREIMGGFTLLDGDPLAFPISRDCPALVFPSCRVSEVSISGIHKDFRGLESSTQILASMYGSLYWHLIKNETQFVYAILDRGVSTLYKRRLGLDFVKIGDDFLKWQEVVFPARLDVPMAKEFLIRNRPEIWDIFMQYQPFDTHPSDRCGPIFVNPTGFRVEIEELATVETEQSGLHGQQDH